MTDQIALLDGNVLVALVVATHEHHDAAQAWHHGGLRYATCPITQGTLLRMLVRLGHDPAQAVAILERITTSTRHRFWPDDVPFDGAILRGVQGHRQVTDAYLAQLARNRRGTVVTFDRGFAVTHADVVPDGALTG